METRKSSVPLADTASGNRITAARCPDTLAKTTWLIWLLPIVVSLWVRPILPIDETRYLSVAWSMWRDGQFIVPYLNGLPYAHKPPLLFWLINAGWTVFGPNEIWPRLIQPLFASGSLILLSRIAKQAWPRDPGTAALAPMVFAGTWFVAAYTPTIMFDMLVVFFTLLTWLGMCGKNPRWWLVTSGLALGLLAKGPVIFVYTLPALLIVPLLRSKTGGRRLQSFRSLGLSLAIALVPILLWILLARLRAGPVFIDEVMWTQTAERLSGDMGHGRPPWWYLEFLPVMCLPWIVWPPAWRAVRTALRDDASRLFLGAAASALVILSMVGGKQAHYLLPAFAVAAPALAHGLANDTAVRRSDLWGTAILLAIIGILLLSVAAGLLGDRVPPWADSIAMAWPLVLIAGAVALVALSSRVTMFGATVQVATSSLVLLSLLAGPVVASRTVYDLSAASENVARLQSDARPVAFLGNYHGEFDFLGRLRRPLEELDADSVPAWVEEHPRGVLVTRRKHVDGDYPAPIYAQPYRSGELDMFEARDLAEAALTYTN